ncbi:MAG TPA: SusD/RagB family nutrient-binding outer membrane lipoprotein [Segetibacter sp.]|jgi:hypothetical protein
MEKKKFINVLAAVILLITLITGCKKSTFNINGNPNQPTDSTVTYDVILPAALHGTGTVIANDWAFLQNWMGYWARSGTYAPSFAEETYTITTSFQTGVWNDLFNNNYDYQVMQNKAKQANAAFYEGIARIMKAHNYQILVDVYNDVPYSQALRGSANPTPAYDKGIDIYKDLFRQVDTGIALIKGATASQSVNIATNDIMFAGSKSLWAKFGNTLKLRMLVHLMNGINTRTLATGIDVAAEFGKINTEGSGYLLAGQNAQVQPGYTSDKPNPFWLTYKADAAGTATQGSVYYKANDYGIEYYKWNGDPRTSYYYVAGSNGLVGVKYGLPAATENVAANLAGIGTGIIKSVSMPQWVLTATESLFLQAEAQERGFLVGTAKTTLTAAIAESMSFLGVPNSTTSANSYITANAGYPDVDYSAPATGAGLPVGGLYTIIQQKWFALNTIAPFEVYSDFRRNDMTYSGKTVNHFVTGVASGFAPGPPISVSPNNTSTEIPTRLLYPQTEYNYNATNVKGQGTIDRYGRVFWDLK